MVPAGLAGAGVVECDVPRAVLDVVYRQAPLPQYMPRAPDDPAASRFRQEVGR